MARCLPPEPQLTLPEFALPDRLRERQAAGLYDAYSRRNRMAHRYDEKQPTPAGPETKDASPPPEPREKVVRNDDGVIPQKERQVKDGVVLK